MCIFHDLTCTLGIVFLKKKARQIICIKVGRTHTHIYIYDVVYSITRKFECIDLNLECTNLTFKNLKALVTFLFSKKEITRNFPKEKFLCIYIER